MSVAEGQHRRQGFAALHKFKLRPGPAALYLVLREAMYCGPDLRQLAALIQAAKDSSPVLKLATRSCAPRT